VTRRRLSAALVAAFALACAAGPAAPLRAQGSRAVDPALYAGLRWRNVGPFRGGRAVAVTGIPGDPRTFYFGAVGGGVWKTGNAGRTWTPVMDGQPVASIGAVAVAPSDPATVYVGTGEADMRSDIQHGNGMYRSNDAGATWTRIGLEDSRTIGRILVDPHDPKTLLVAALGHQYGPNDMRGVYRSTDGGASWTRTLFRDRDTGAIDFASDPEMKTVYASLWQTRRPPWSVYPPSHGPGSGLYKSLDGGVTWAPVRGSGFPSESLGKIGLAVAPSDPNRVYAILDAKAGGLYRSDDAGATWKLADGDKRLWGRGWYFCHVAVDPRNPDLVYVANTALYRSTDGGASFTAIKGSPDGDDFQQLWIDPSDGSRMIQGSDQGATISIDGARTWSSWFNQPTAQFYNVRADDAFPYRLYGAQQDSGAAMIVSRSAHRGIQERDWRAINAGGESGSVAPDPDSSDVVFGNNPVVREDVSSSQTRALGPTTGREGEWRSEWTQPMAFGPDRALYTANQVVFRTRDRGAHWQQISGDLTRPHPSVPATLDVPTAKDTDGGEARGVVYALAPSPLRANTVWAGTDDGLIRLTRDGGRTWRDVTPRALTPWSHVDAIEASRFDAATAYAAVDRHRLDDDRPYVYVTHDGGRTWRAAVNGIAPGSFVYAVREDPRRRGLLYAGTESGVYVSFDGGAAWQSLRLNLPVVSVHDLIVHGDDLAIATHGRAFWILDGVGPLRALARDASPAARLFPPSDAVRLRPPNDEAEASPPETPLGENPPDGAPLDYVVPRDARGTIALAIADASGSVVRAWSSADPPAPTPAPAPYPAYWNEPPARLATTPGMHRFFWDFHVASSASGSAHRGGAGPLAPPGRYTVRVTIAGRTFAQTLVVRRDPRVRASDRDLVAQYALAREIDGVLARLQAATGAVTSRRRKAPGALSRYASAAAELADSVESADAAPTPTERAAWSALRPKSEAALRAWKASLRR
jgi:photosystem II stability/assembly factor-like uncharacterized protein